MVLTPAELTERLEQAGMNGKFAPDLLESKPGMVECVMEQRDHMEENLRRVKKGDLKISINQMEMERIRYVLSSYLRCQFMKIEKFFPHVLEKEKTRHQEEPFSRRACLCQIVHGKHGDLSKECSLKAYAS